jgi:DNA-binding NtrC family response regulator
MVSEGRFREDLYYRIGLITMQLPPLRSYKNNLPILARVMLQRASRSHGKQVSGITPEAMALLQASDFPGNVRELRNAIEHAVILTSGEEIEVRDLPAAIRRRSGTRPARRQRNPGLKKLREVWLAPLEKRYLADLLTECGGNVRKASARAGINAVTMYRLLDKHGLKLHRSVAE